ncbi:hypothetical protein CRG98_009471 [Punica granatum]|uniref:Uncharacterized protein n=1 Tax=Punica granatum TaxID=22663 RepID=A0A2I0KNX4_PUNGR|nr:hypothetical protein CRG98_009471 [Punica granatum]
MAAEEVSKGVSFEGFGCLNQDGTAMAAEGASRGVDSWEGGRHSGGGRISDRCRSFSVVSFRKRGVYLE